MVSKEKKRKKIKLKRKRRKQKYMWTLSRAIREEDKQTFQSDWEGYFQVVEGKQMIN
jgi:hypothetical protein